MAEQLDLFGHVPVANAAARAAKVEPMRRATICAFPSARNVWLVARIAHRLAPLSAAKREIAWQRCAERMLRRRQADGLTRARAFKDVVDFRDAVRALVYRLQGQAPSDRASGE